MTKGKVEKLMRSGDIVECAACGRLSAFSWRNADESSDIAVVGACSAYEWQCGHCRSVNVDAHAPILAEVYTHQEYAAA